MFFAARSVKLSHGFEILDQMRDLSQKQSLVPSRSEVLFHCEQNSSFPNQYFPDCPILLKLMRAWLDRLPTGIYVGESFLNTTRRSCQDHVSMITMSHWPLCCITFQQQAHLQSVTRFQPQSDFRSLRGPPTWNHPARHPPELSGTEFHLPENCVCG